MDPHPFDAITLDHLRARGGLKWAANPDRIGAWVAEMDFGTAPVVMDAIRSSVGAELFGYLPPALDDALAAATSAWLDTRYGWAVAPERIRPLGDVVAGLVAALEHFSEPGSKVIVPTPAYTPFLEVSRTHGRDVVEVPLTMAAGRWVYDLDALDRAFAAGGGLLVLCNPHNPVGRVLDRAELLAIAEVVERHGGRVFADEIHAPLTFAGHTHLPYASLSPVTAGHTITAVAASKAWNLPGLKCAQLLLSSSLDAETWAQVGAEAEHGASNLGVVATIAAYTSGGPWLADVLDYLTGTRRLLGELMASLLPGVGYVEPEGTYLALLDFRPLGLGDSPADLFAAEAGVVLVDGALCGAAGRGMARLNFATPRPILRQMVEQLAAALPKR